MLLKYFLMGPRVLRIAQISGWVTSEVKRRKKGLLTAVASAENQAMSNTEPDNKSAELSESELQTTVQEANIYIQHGKKVLEEGETRKKATAKKKATTHKHDALQLEEGDEDEEEEGEAQEDEPSTNEEDEEEYEVKRIVDKEIRAGSIWYQCWWKNYTKAEATWEPVEALANASNCIGEYEKGKQQRKRKRK